MAPFQRSLEPERGYFVMVEPTARHRQAVQALAQWLLDEARVPA